MADQDFEQRLANRIRQDSDHGLRPYDALEIARVSMSSAPAGTRLSRPRNGGMPAWFRSLALASLLVVLLVAAAFVGGLIRLPNVVIVQSPTPSDLAEASPTPTFPLPSSLPPTLPPTVPPASIDPSPSVDPSASPSQSAEPSPSASPSASPSPSPTASPSPTPATGWREIEDFPAGRRMSLSDVAHGRAGFVIVGRGGSGGRSWFSPDGLSWTRSTDSAFTGARHVVAMGGQFYAIASDGTWRSADGLSWTLLTSTPGLGVVNDVVAENGVLVAVGTDNDFEQPMIWLSGDGVSWTSHGTPERTSELSHVAVRGGDMVVIGDGLGGHGRKLFFKATHTSEWQEIDPFGEDQDGRLVGLASNGGRFVAVGYWDDFDSGRRHGLALSSVDGSSWTRTTIDDRDSLVFDQVVALPDNRFLAVASQSYYIVGECRPAGCMWFEEDAFSYVSANGLSWTPRNQVYHRYEAWPSEVGDQIEHPRSIAAGPQGIVLVDDDWVSGWRVFFAPAGTD